MILDLPLSDWQFQRIGLAFETIAKLLEGKKILADLAFYLQNSNL